MLFHICAGQLDICFELAMVIMERIGDAVSVADEVQSFRYFEDRTLLVSTMARKIQEARLLLTPLCW